MFRASRQLRALTSAPTRRLLTTTPRALQQRPSMADDPYPLPLASLHVTPEQDRSGATAREPDVDLSDPNLPFPDPLPREGESIENLRARLLYQTRKRGTLESDLLMSTFGQEHMPNMSEAELKEFDKFLDENDWDTFYWATEKRQPPERWANSELLQKLIKHTRNDEKVARRMPVL